MNAIDNILYNGQSILGHHSHDNTVHIFQVIMTIFIAVITYLLFRKEKTPQEQKAKVPVRVKKDKFPPRK